MEIKSYIVYKDKIIFILLGAIFGIILLVINSSFVLADTTLVSVSSEKVEPSFLGGIYSFFGNIASYCYIPIKKIAWFPMEVFNIPKKVYYTFVSESSEIVGENILTVASVENSSEIIGENILTVSPMENFSASSGVMEEEEVLKVLDIRLLDNYLKELQDITKKMEEMFKVFEVNKQCLFKENEKMFLLDREMSKINNFYKMVWELEKDYWYESELKALLSLLEENKKVFQLKEFVGCSSFVDLSIKWSNGAYIKESSFKFLGPELRYLDYLFVKLLELEQIACSEIRNEVSLGKFKTNTEANFFFIEYFKLGKNEIFKEEKQFLSKNRLLLQMFNIMHDCVMKDLIKNKKTFML